MTAPDHITSTAPKRIYLDLDGESPSIKPEDTFRDIEMRMGFTWSENCAMGYGIPYVRADLVPTPAASGAAPALPTPWKTVTDATGEPVQVWRAFQMRDYARAVLALASPQVAPEGWRPISTVPEDGSVVHLCAEGDTCWTARVFSSVLDEKARVIVNHDPMGDRQVKPTHWRPCATPVQVAPQDDARDAAEVWNEAIEAAARRIEGGSFLHDQAPAKLFANQLAPVIRSMKRTPAAKPTEERS